jgi:hypothetical protein
MNINHTIDKLYIRHTDSKWHDSLRADAPTKGKNGLEMNKNADKRACGRQRYVADIAYSYFNKEQSYEAQALNFSMGGMCMKSNLYVQPGSVIYIRIIRTHLNGSDTGFCEAIRLVALGEVKWCHEESAAGNFFYKVGVKYFERVY